MAWLGIRKIQHFSAQRAWGTFSAGLVLGPAVIFTLEIMAFLFALFMGVFAFAFNPQNLIELEKFAGGFEDLLPGSSEEIAILTQMLNNPTAIFLILLFLSVIVPLIEEAFKPIGVWFLVGRDPTPMDGFAAGIISGTGYALFENLGNISLGLSWSTVVLARIGTSVLHIFTAGLIGYTLALAWKENRYLRLGVAYLSAVLIHGIWNALTVLSTIAGLGMDDSILPYYLLPTGGIALVALASGLFVLLILSNRKVQRQGSSLKEAVQTADTFETKE
jgi:RsiW-degrading membrane proteinase PrsW (M82 family)